MKKYSYNCGQPVQKFVVPTLAETINLIDKLRRSKKLFRVDFIKRTTGEMRTMICRFGVTKYLKGGEAAYDFGEKGLFPVYDINRQGYRSVPIDNISFIKFAGTVYWLNMNGALDFGTYPPDLFNDIEQGRTIPASTSPLYENIEDTVGAF